MKNLSQLAKNILLCRCPRCGQAIIFDGFLKLVVKCAACELPIAKNDNGDGPAVFLTFILGFALVPPAIILALNVDWPLWLHGVIWGFVILGSTLGALRPAKALTLYLHYRHKPESFS